MRRGARTAIVATTALTAAVTLAAGVTLPSASIDLGDAPFPGHVAGAYHIHSDRSDGTGSVDQIAAAAARAGLAFIIVTDHGDATRSPDPPTYRHGVLTIDAVEVNTQEGHVVALGLREASPYPLAGHAPDVIEDIHRMGGLAVIAHPDSPRSELAWRGANLVSAGADGLEWINADAEWRDDSALTLIARAAQASIRPAEAVGALFSRPARTLQRWDNASRARPQFGLAAVDAHANISWRDQEEPRRQSAFARPSYETMFRTLVQTVVLDRPLNGAPADDATRIIGAIASGRSYSTVRAQAWPSALQFTAEQNQLTHHMGARLDERAGPVSFTARITSAPGARIALLRNGTDHVGGQGSVFVDGQVTPGVYRVEAYLPGVVMPWVVSNPIVIEGEAPTGGNRGSGAGRRGGVVPAGTTRPQPVAAEAPQWTIEHDATSEGRVVAAEGRLRFEYQLGDGPARGQYAALVYGGEGDDGIETVSFVATSAAPARVSVQVRLPAGRGRVGQRWRTSIFVDQTVRRYVLRLQDFEPADRPTVRRPIVTPIQSLLFVVDTINSLPGASGTLWLSDVELGINPLQ